MAGLKQYVFLYYNEAQRICKQYKITTREQYRAFRKEYIDLISLPANPPECVQWKGYWKGWNEFLRNKELIPRGAIHLTNHYYKYKNRVYHHTALGFIQLECRRMSNDKFYTEIRLKNDERKNIRIKSVHIVKTIK
jgi:hypothetical protein